jgi:ADP-ribose pyrophosphatase YjhB (NUDIX family)
MVLKMSFPYRFCPRCGACLDALREGAIEQVCAACGIVHYHNAKPCAGAFVIHNGQVMLVRRVVEPFKDYWDIPGGFLNPDEHPQAGAIREVREETGLEIRTTGLHGVYMDKYHSNDSEYHTLNIYYLAEVIDGMPEPHSDAVEIGWFAPDALPEKIAFAHARVALEGWSVAALGKDR